MAKLTLYKVWRSEIWGISLFALFSILSIYFSATLPSTVLTGELFSIFSYHVLLSLPTLWLIPLITLLILIARIYDVQYKITSDGIEATVGRISVHQKVVKIRYEDVKGIEVNQTLWERILNIGNIAIGTAGTGDIEVSIEGIAAPIEVQKMLKIECEARQTAQLRAKSSDSNIETNKQ